MSTHVCTPPSSQELAANPVRHWECPGCRSRWFLMGVMRGRRSVKEWKRIPAGSSLNEQFDAAVASVRLSGREFVRQTAEHLGIVDPKAFRLAQAPATTSLGFYLTSVESVLLQRAAIMLDRGTFEFDDSAAETLALVLRSVANSRDNATLATRLIQLARHFAPDHDPSCDSDTCVPDCGVAKAKREDS